MMANHNPETGKMVGAELNRGSDSVQRPVRHSGWFSHYHDEAEDGWDGPHKHIEDAVAAMVDNDAWGYGMPIYIRRGRKLTTAEREEWGVDYKHQCTPPSIIVYLPNAVITHDERSEELGG